jgi:hypothetical protein
MLTKETLLLLCWEYSPASSYLFGHPVLVLQLVEGRVIGPGGWLFIGPPIVTTATVAATSPVPVSSKIGPENVSNQPITSEKCFRIDQ